MEVIKVDYRGKPQEVIATIMSFLALLAGLLILIAPGQSFFLFAIPPGKEFVGLFLGIAGIFGIQEVRAQKRFNALVDNLKSRHL